MKALGLFMTGLLLTVLFGTLHFGLLNDLILQLPEQPLLFIADWIDQGKTMDWQMISIAMMLVGLFSFRIKKEEHQF